MSAPAPDPDDLPQEGDVIAGKYRVERVLGQGGMGVVVAAEHLTLRQTVAIKLLLPEAMEREDAVERFLREGRAARAITSEHIARVHDVGTVEGGRPYMVMEYLVGSDLGDLLRDRGALPIGEAVDYLLQACEAIAEAHMLGIVHRDLKPANIFVTRRVDGTPLVKVLDFGLSKITKADTLEPSLTSANTVMGSPYYMSPEQVRSLKSIDARADIWALGVILYQLISNQRPFQEESLGALFVQIGAEPPANIRDFVPDIPEELEAVLYKCLEKAPASRFQSVAELARALAPFASDGSRISIERILRTLDDHAPLVRAPMVSSPELERPSVPNVQIVPPGPTAIPHARRSAPPPSGPVPSSKQQVPSQSNPALASSLAAPVTEGGGSTGRHDKASGSRAIVYVLASALALVGGAATMLLLMRPEGPPIAAGAGAASDATSLGAEVPTAAPTPEPSVVPAPPTASASASAEPAPTASASAAASTTPSASAAVTATVPKKTFIPPPKKKIDPLDRR